MKLTFESMNSGKQFALPNVGGCQPIPRAPEENKEVEEEFDHFFLTT